MADYEHRSVARSGLYRTDLASRLPGDVLSEIFLLLREVLQLEDYGRESNLPWIHSTTHVCRSWRRLAVSSPLLWTHVILQSPRISSLFLDRSADLPLDVLGEIEEYEDDEEVLRVKMESIETCAAKTGSLDLKIPGHAIDVLPNDRTIQFPRLVKLSIEIYETGSTEAPLPPFIGGLDSLPQLRELRTVTLSLSEVNPLIFNGLRKLELGGFAGEFTFDDLLSALEILSGGPLEELSLWSGIPSSADTYDDNGDNAPSELPSFGRSISLPHLRALRLDGDGGSCAILLQHLVIPPSTMLKLTFESDPDIRDLPPTLAAVGRALLGPQVRGRFAQEVTALHIEPFISFKEGLTITGWKTQPSTSQFFALSTTGLPCEIVPTSPPSIQMELLEYSFNAIIAALSPSLHLHSVKSLSFGRRMFPADFKLPKATRIAHLTKLFHQLPSVEILSVSSFLSRDLPEALALADAGYDDRTLPLLRVLNIGAIPPDLQMLRDTLPSLVESLQIRAKLGHRLELIRLPHNHSYTPDDAEMEVFRECAETVEFYRYQSKSEGFASEEGEDGEDDGEEEEDEDEEEEE